MDRIARIALGLTLLAAFACSKTDDLSNYSLGTEIYHDQSDCKQAYFKGNPIPGVFLKRMNKAQGERLEGVACHDKVYVIDAIKGTMTEGSL
jgi:hypothetical protein